MIELEIQRTYSGKIIDILKRRWSWKGGGGDCGEQACLEGGDGEGGGGGGDERGASGLAFRRFRSINLSP